MEFAIEFDLGLTTPFTDITKDNWKEVILKDYDDNPDQSDYILQLVEAITDEIRGDEELVRYFYEDAEVSEILDCMTLKDFTLMEKFTGSIGCIVKFSVDFDTDSVS